MLHSYPSTSSMDSGDSLDMQQHTPITRRPHSIDQALELEHQLNNELSPPSSPTSKRPQSLDPHILASIVTQLRMSLSEVSQERDELASRLSGFDLREARLQASLQDATDERTRLQSELKKAQEKMTDDEEAISMLRTKVEESRRGLMKLQTDSRRMSQMSNMTLDMSRAGPASFGGPSSSKRASFTPLTGSGMNAHRRISSVSDSGFLLRDLGSSENVPGSPNAQILTFPDIRQTAVASPSVKASRRVSGFFSRLPPTEEPPNESFSLVAELQTVRSELKTVKSELEETRHELTEASEAREASETCVKALRDFIAENNIGGQQDQGDRGSAPLRLPPPPYMTTRDDEDGKKSTSGSGWGFKLWKVDTSVNDVNTRSATVLSPTRSASAPTPQSSTPLAKKLGGFFGSRASISSVTSLPAHPTPGSNPKEVISDNSDVSSMEESAVEPISPASETPLATIMIRDDRSSSDSGIRTERIATEEIDTKAGMNPLSL